MAEHGFLQPNPILFNLETRKPKSYLRHELGQGAKCSKCDLKCTGFQLHFWRKVCQNCRCGKIEHGVKEKEDHGQHFIGKIFERPLRSKEEECQFIYGEVSDDIETQSHVEVTLDWAPPGIASSLASKYLKTLPQGHIPIQGSEGAIRRRKQLEKQFPLHDVEPEICHQLTTGEINLMTSYVDNVKKNVAGQGIVEELGLAEDDLDCKPHNVHKELSPSPPLPLPPPMNLLNAETLSYTLAGTNLDKKLSYECVTYPANMGTYHATPYCESDETNKFCTKAAGDSNLMRYSNGHLNQAIDFNPKDLYVNRRNPYSSVDNDDRIQSEISAVSNSWHCSGCQNQMFPGEIAIFAERAGRNKCWHPACFSCAKCGEMLEDLLYFYNKGQLFCARDFASLMSIPRCSACDELIFSREYTGAEDRFWHFKHFCCFLCDIPLAGHKYIPEAGMPHCLACWQHHYGKVCVACSNPIDAQGQRVTLGEQHWHASSTCFRCGVCAKSLLGGKVTKRQNTLLCSSICSQALALQTNSLSIKRTNDSNEKPLRQENCRNSHLRELQMKTPHKNLKASKDDLSKTVQSTPELKSTSKADEHDMKKSISYSTFV